jgi:osmotically inducible lipoprotein OsmB
MWMEGIMLRLTMAIVGVGVLLAGCGSSTTGRSPTAADIDPATGGAAGAVTGGSVLGGAVLGGAAGAAAGGLTDEDDIDLGDPLWD